MVEFNDLAGLERELAEGDVAVVLMEPALTNIGIVLPEPGYLDAVRELARRSGTLLINDETHTFSAGPGGCTRAWNLDPDIVTIGKSIAGGIPAGAFGLSAGLADRIMRDETADIIDTGGVGGTLAGNALSVAAMRATLEQVLTDAAFAANDRAGRPVHGRGARRHREPRPALEHHPARCPRGVPLLPAAAAHGGESDAAANPKLDEYLHLYTVNRGVLLTPFHNMALMSPGHHRGRRGYAHPDLRGRGRRPAGLSVARRSAGTKARALIRCRSGIDTMYRVCSADRRRTL